MATFHEFDQDQIDASLRAAAEHYDHSTLRTQGLEAGAADDGHLRMLAAECLSVTVEDGKICLKIPIAGKVCLPIPSFIPNGTAAEVCLHICTKFGVPTGVKVTISVAGKQILEKSFGIC